MSASSSPTGSKGEKFLACGISIGMRLWENEPIDKHDEPHSHPYEVVGYALSGRAELHVEDQVVILEPGDSWVVNRGVDHSYRILEPFTAIEASHPPSHLGPSSR